MKEFTKELDLNVIQKDLKNPDFLGYCFYFELPKIMQSEWQVRVATGETITLISKVDFENYETAQLDAVKNTKNEYFKKVAKVTIFNSHLNTPKTFGDWKRIIKNETIDYVLLLFEKLKYAMPKYMRKDIHKLILKKLREAE